MSDGNVTVGVHWLKHRGEQYASLKDLVAALDAFEEVGRAEGHNTFLIVQFRQALTYTCAVAK